MIQPFPRRRRQWTTAGQRVVVLAICAVFLSIYASPSHAEPYPDRLVWIFGWSLRQDRDVAEISQVLQDAAAHGFNGAVMSLGLDTLCKKDPDYLRRLRCCSSRL